jgi:hypothetical protein
MWNCKTLKIPKIPKLIQNFKTSKVLDHITMGYNVDDVLKEVVFYYTKNIKILKINFGYD